jgi:hypothetical protein
MIAIAVAPITSERTIRPFTIVTLLHLLGPPHCDTTRRVRPVG